MGLCLTGPPKDFGFDLPHGPHAGRLKDEHPHERGEAIERDR